MNLLKAIKALSDYPGSAEARARSTVDDAELNSQCLESVETTVVVQQTAADELSISVNYERATTLESLSLRCEIAENALSNLNADLERQLKYSERVDCAWRKRLSVLELIIEEQRKSADHGKNSVAALTSRVAAAEMKVEGWAMRAMGAASQLSDCKAALSQTEERLAAMSERVVLRESEAESIIASRDDAVSYVKQAEARIACFNQRVSAAEETYRLRYLSEISLISKSMDDAIRREAQLQAELELARKSRVQFEQASYERIDALKNMVEHLSISSERWSALNVDQPLGLGNLIELAEINRSDEEQTAA